MGVKLLRSKDDPTYQKYLKVLLACQEAGIDDIPKEVNDYFGGYGIDSDPEFPLEIKFEPKEWRKEDGLEGFEIRLNDLPQGVEVIRFFNSY
jgi:hypothetical protein